MDDADLNFLSNGEREFLLALNDVGVRFMVVGMSAALLQGARGATDRRRKNRAGGQEGGRVLHYPEPSGQCSAARLETELILSFRCLACPHSRLNRRTQLRNRFLG